jgi:hypothetical protein
MSQKIRLKKNQFQSFLKGLSKINDRLVLYSVDDVLYSITSSEDNALYLHAHMEAECGEDFKINLPSISKLDAAIKVIREDDIEITLNKNRLDYRGGGLKFSYHLLDDGVLTEPKISLQKLNSFTYDIEFEVSSKFLTQLLKQFKLTPTDKVYIYTLNDKLIWKLGDETKPNTDSFEIESMDVDFNIEEPIIIKSNNLKLISATNSDLKFNINSKMRITKISIEQEELTMDYYLTSHVK